MASTYTRTPSAPISIDQFRAKYPIQGKIRRDNQLAKHLETLMTDYLPYKTDELSLPPISELARFFQCSYIEVFDAFKLLRLKGFDFNLTGLEKPIKVWRPKNDIPRAYALYSSYSSHSSYPLHRRRQP